MNNVEIFKNTKEVRSPEIKIKTSNLSSKEIKEKIYQERLEIIKGYKNDL